MVLLYVTLILNGLKTIEQVPSHLRAAVEEELEKQKQKTIL